MAVDTHRIAFDKSNRDFLRRNVEVALPKRHTHDRLHHTHAGVEKFEQFRLVRGAPDIGIGGVRFFFLIAVGKPPFVEPIAHFVPAAEFCDKCCVEPRFVDLHVGIGH